MDQKIKKMLGILALLIILVLLCCILSYYIYSAPYSNFLKIESGALEKFAKLDQTLSSQIPTPVGVTEKTRLEKKNPGLIHGAIMYIEYEMGQLSPADILNFYEAHFYKLGWDQFVLSDYWLPHVVFYKDSACVEVFFGAGPNSYELQIYHDYFAYEFSPTPPWIINWHEIDNGGPKYIRCPPFLDPEY
jgi:hypothetical protein